MCLSKVVGQRHFQGRGNLIEVKQGDITFAPFDIADVSPVQVPSPGKNFLKKMLAIKSTDYRDPTISESAIKTKAGHLVSFGRLKYCPCNLPKPSFGKNTPFIRRKIPL